MTYSTLDYAVRLVFEPSKEDGKEGVTSFVEKRAPEFKGRPSGDLPRVFDLDGEPPFNPTGAL